MNQHLISHIPLVVSALGPLPLYGARAMERAANLYSNSIGSRSAAGVNVMNVLDRLHGIRYVQNTYNATQNEISYASDSFESISDAPDAPQLWGPFEEIFITELEEHAELGISQPVFEEALESYWTHTEHPDVDDVLKNDRLRICGRLWRHNIIHTSLYYRRQRSRCNNYCTMMIEVSRFPRSSRPGLVNRLYCGQVVFYFIHQCGDEKRYLALVRIFKDVHKSQCFAAYDSTKGFLLKVVEAAEIITIAGLVKMAPGSSKSYVCWSKGGWPSDPDTGKPLELGDPTLIP